jgi:hypothetical protein
MEIHEEMNRFRIIARPVWVKYSDIVHTSSISGRLWVRMRMRLGDFFKETHHHNVWTVLWLKNLDRKATAKTHSGACSLVFGDDPHRR